MGWGCLVGTGYAGKGDAGVRDQESGVGSQESGVRGQEGGEGPIGSFLRRSASYGGQDDAAGWRCEEMSIEWLVVYGVIIMLLLADNLLLHGKKAVKEVWKKREKDLTYGRNR